MPPKKKKNDTGITGKIGSSGLRFALQIDGLFT
jgi:hypothetical protein